MFGSLFELWRKLSACEALIVSFAHANVDKLIKQLAKICMLMSALLDMNNNLQINIKNAQLILVDIIID
jgi:hypothetical protein